LEAVVAWGPGERERAEEVVSAAGAGSHLAPPTDLEELTALVGRAALVVGGDTGPVHLSASLSVPTLAVFLASDQRRNAPLGERVAVVSGAEERLAAPTGSARAKPIRVVAAEEISAAVRDLLSVRPTS
jgi:ADP-heptose:LPS heptosyltransferase